jgi:hypothetical protein
LLQTTWTTPRRRTILHLSQILLTLAFTFIALNLIADNQFWGNGAIYTLDSRAFKGCGEGKLTGDVPMRVYRSLGL